MYGAWRDVQGSLDAGWTAEESWLIYGESCPRTWASLIGAFSEASLAGATIFGPLKVLVDQVPEGYTDQGRLQWLDRRAAFGVYLEE